MRTPAGTAAGPARTATPTPTPAASAAGARRQPGGRRPHPRLCLGDGSALGALRETGVLGEDPARVPGRRRLPRRPAAFELGVAHVQVEPPLPNIDHDA